ncbi:MAG: DUF2017 family protein [Acidimicrobiia bacterium]
MARVFADATGVTIELEHNEAELLGALPSELRAYFDVVMDPEDPVYQRLFPRAYLDPTEDQAEMEFTAFVRPQSVEERLSALDGITVALEDATPVSGMMVVRLTPDEADGWARAINEARLTLGVQLHISEEHELDGLDPSDPRAPIAAIYGWLSWLQTELIEALLPAYEDIPESED